MISEEVQSISDKLNNQGKMVFLEGASEEQITAFEQENAVTLPKEYKEWLRFSDGGDFFLPAGVQLHGVAHKPFIDVHDFDRPSEGYVVIGAMSFGDPILFERDSGRVSIYNHEAGRIEDDETYADFFAFLNDLDHLLGIGG